MKILVIGGTSFIGRLLVQELVKAGHAVTILHRHPGHDLGRKVGELIADRNDADALADVLTGHRFDAVFDNAYDWERGTTATQVEATVRAVGDRIQRYVFMSSVAAYGDGLNHQEGDPLAPDTDPNPYVRHKAMSERMLLRLHQRTGFPVVTLRPPFVFGPGNPFYREAFFWDRLREGRPIVLPGDGRRLMQFVFVKDLVWAMLRVVEEPGVNGHSFNIANAKPLSQLEVVQALADAAGKKPNIVRVPRERIVAAGGSAMGPQHLYFGVYYDLPPVTMFINKAQRVLGFQPTPFAAALKESYRWYQKHHKREPIDTAFEDFLMAGVAAVRPEGARI